MAPPSAVDVTAVTDTQGVTTPNPFSLALRSNQIHGRRKKADNSQWGIAAPARSSQFTHLSLKSKPKAKRWDRELPFRHLRGFTTDHEQTISMRSQKVAEATSSRKRPST